VAHESLRVRIGGGEFDELYRDLVSLEVELDEDLAALCRVRLALLLRPDGRWTHLDDERLAPWQPLSVSAGLDGEEEELFSGYVTHVRPDFGEGLDRCRLEVWAMDASVLLDRDDVLKDWPSKKDSDIAQEVFHAHGLEPHVTDTGVVHDQQVSTVIQRETDMQFLQRLALRNGYQCYVEGRRGHFGPPVVAPGRQPVLAVHFGEDTNVLRFALEVDALAPATVAMAQVDRLTKEVLGVSAGPGRQPALGADPLTRHLPPGRSPGLVQLERSVTTGTPEMTTLCQGLSERGAWFVTGEGELDSHRYGAVLRPRSTVVLKGVGETHSGTYLVTRVRHSFVPGGYTQVFGVKRDALRPDGTEDFTGGGSLLGALL
jgi:hypothetical protein